MGHPPWNDYNRPKASKRIQHEHPDLIPQSAAIVDPSVQRILQRVPARRGRRPPGPGSVRATTTKTAFTSTPAASRSFLRALGEPTADATRSPDPDNLDWNGRPSRPRSTRRRSSSPTTKGEGRRAAAAVPEGQLRRPNGTSSSPATTRIVTTCARSAWTASRARSWSPSRPTAR